MPCARVSRPVASRRGVVDAMQAEQDALLEALASRTVAGLNVAFAA